MKKAAAVIGVGVLFTAAGVVGGMLLKNPHQSQPGEVRITPTPHYVTAQASYGPSVAASPQAAWLGALHSDLCFTAGDHCALQYFDRELDELLGVAQLPAKPQPVPRILETTMALVNPQIWSATSRVAFDDGKFGQFTGRIHAVSGGWQVTAIRFTG